MKHFVFDLDGTLVESFTPYFENLSRVFSKYKAQFNEADIPKSLGMHSKDFMRLYVKEEDLEKAHAEMKERSNYDAQFIQPFEGIISILQMLNSKQRSTVLFTNRERKSTEMILHHSKLASFFPFYVTGDDVKNLKPSPDGLHLIADRFGWKPEDIVMIGDHEIDIHAGRAFGSHTLRVTWSPFWKDHVCNISHQQFHSTTDFEKFILNLA